jgi:hypothetical protein
MKTREQALQKISELFTNSHWKDTPIPMKQEFHKGAMAMYDWLIKEEEIMEDKKFKALEKRIKKVK